jgi:hypothetical protein
MTTLRGAWHASAIAAQELSLLNANCHSYDKQANP